MTAPAQRIDHRSSTTWRWRCRARVAPPPTARRELAAHAGRRASDLNAADWSTGAQVKGTVMAPSRPILTASPPRARDGAEGRRKGREPRVGATQQVDSAPRAEAPRQGRGGSERGQAETAGGPAIRQEAARSARCAARSERGRRDRRAGEQHRRALAAKAGADASAERRRQGERLVVASGRARRRAP